jgi:hypothetical protein
MMSWSMVLLAIKSREKQIPHFVRNDKRAAACATFTESRHLLRVVIGEIWPPHRCHPEPGRPSLANGVRDLILNLQS